MKRKAFALWLSVVVLLVGLIFFRIHQLSLANVAIPMPFSAQATPSVPDQISYSHIVPTCTPKPHRPNFQTGVVFPQWGSNAYSNSSSNWSTGLNQIATTHACWISMTLPFHMTGAASTSIETRRDTPTVQAFHEGVQKAHNRGYHILIEPLITLDGPYAWAGYIKFSTLSMATQWFGNYSHVLAPYLAIANEEHVEEFSLGNEFDILDRQYPPLWHRLLQTVHVKFKGSITYSLNWASLKKPLPTWLDDPLLSVVGISCYFPVTQTPARLNQQEAIDDWRIQIQSWLDTFAETENKPLLLTEIGYRNIPDAGYQPWVITSNKSRDDQEQAILYQAALQNISTDSHILGTFWWAWKMPLYDPSGKPAIQVLQKWYSYL